jgi:hypothetical protein
MARHALDNSATSAVSRTAVFKVSTAWDVAGNASEHAGTMVRRLSLCAWQSESVGHRIGHSPSKKKPLDEGLIGEVRTCSSCPALRLIQHESVEYWEIGRMMQDVHQ